MNNERLYKIILGAHISEKASVIADEVNQFAFKVAKDATGPEIKQAVEKIYDVEVKKVSVMNVKGKVKRSWRGTSRKPNWKKAYVSLAAGHDIESIVAPIQARSAPRLCFTAQPNHSLPRQSAVACVRCCARSWKFRPESLTKGNPGRLGCSQVISGSHIAPVCRVGPSAIRQTVRPL